MHIRLIRSLFSITVIGCVLCSISSTSVSQWLLANDTCVEVVDHLDQNDSHLVSAKTGFPVTAATFFLLGEEWESEETDSEKGRTLPVAISVAGQFNLHLKGHSPPNTWLVFSMREVYHVSLNILFAVFRL